MNLIKNSLANLKGHKLRVAVALLFIVIGVTSVIVVSSVGNGFEKQITESVSLANSKQTVIYFEPNDQSMDDLTAFLKPITAQDLEELSFVEGVEKLSPSKGVFDTGAYYNEATFDKKSTSIEVSPMKKGTKIDLVAGREITLDDEKRKVVLITLQNATDLFGDPEKAIGSGITISGSIFEVIGVVDDSSDPNEQNNQVAMGPMGGEYPTAITPKKAFNDLMNDQNSYNTDIQMVDLKVSDGYDVFEVANTIIEKLYELHPDINGSYTTPDPTEQMQALETITSSTNKVVSFITVAAMSVGGIGVMNIMYVSVMERQREIGIRRAIGAKPISILLQFLTEAIFITVVGGILGIFVGLAATNYVSPRIGFEVIPSFNSVLYATLATIITGIVFGMIPAYKASKLDPIKAIYK
ncbi:ABC transporter permease [Metaclostridioides mangenotii]|uniref:ABC transporter permease n=1 Tax=Metaclostridioides mangenotii TaxID=1540 RepID=UPI0028E82CF3|nr:ABC transporter permease [Clostridioides mangenotii]